jgi:hypothetical protein
MSHNAPNDRRSSSWRVGLALPTPPTPNRLGGGGLSSGRKSFEELAGIRWETLFERAFRSRRPSVSTFVAGPFRISLVASGLEMLPWQGLLSKEDLAACGIIDCRPEAPRLASLGATS